MNEFYFALKMEVFLKIKTQFMHLHHLKEAFSKAKFCILQPRNFFWNRIIVLMILLIRL